MGLLSFIFFGLVLYLGLIAIPAAADKFMPQH